MKLHSINSEEGRARARQIAAQLEASGKRITFGGAMSLAASTAADVGPGRYQAKLTGQFGIHKYATTYGTGEEASDGKWKVECELQDGRKLYPNMPKDLYDSFLAGAVKAMHCVVVVRKVPIDGREQIFAQLENRDWSEAATTTAAPTTTATTTAAAPEQIAI